MIRCHCGNSVEFKKCCGKYLNDKAAPPTAEALMRSRYSAFVEKNYEYLLNTHDPDTLTTFDLASNSRWAENVQFFGLKILGGEERKDQAVVEFEASFLEKKTGKKQKHHEVSIFRKLKGRWYYSSGE